MGHLEKGQHLIPAHLSAQSHEEGNGPLSVLFGEGFQPVRIDLKMLVPKLEFLYGETGDKAVHFPHNRFDGTGSDESPFARIEGAEVGIVAESKYIHAPLKEYSYANPNSCCWYDEQFLSELPNDYDLLIIDGPIGNNRGNFIHFHELFKKDIPYVIDDTNRETDKQMALLLAEKLKKEVIEIKGWEKEMMILI